MKSNLKFTINWWSKFLKDMRNLPCLLGILSFTIISIVTTLLIGSPIVPIIILISGIGMIILNIDDEEDNETFGNQFIFGVLILLVILILIIMFCWDYYWFLYEKRGGNK